MTARDAWFQFERDVQRVMEHLGFKVEHVAAARRGDRGVDVFATKGVDLDEVAWV
ncbi:MAG: restriction endonuclease, partial [Moraxellaceae bacterium]